jgi:hypothetical protein
MVESNVDVGVAERAAEFVFSRLEVELAIELE